jgi:hypothetical protein
VREAEARAAVRTAGETRGAVLRANVVEVAGARPWRGAVVSTLLSG